MCPSIARSGESAGKAHSDQIARPGAAMLIGPWRYSNSG